MATITLSRVASAARSRAAASGAARREFSSIMTAVEEFPGLPTTSPTPGKATSASVTTLPNGLTVVTEDASATSTLSLTFPSAGSSAESASQQGAALANKAMAFKSGSGLSSALILRNIENDGATPFASAGRVGATIGFTAAPDKVVRIMPLLATDCTFEKWDVRDAIALAGYEAAQANSNAQIALTEQIYAAAFGAQTSMGRPFYSSGASKQAVRSFREANYGLNGAVLAATGVEDHEAFVRAAEHQFSESPVGDASAPSDAPAFIGGEARIQASIGYAHVAIAFPAPASSALASVVKHCLAISGAEAFAGPGIVGVYGGADSAGVAGIVDSLCAAALVSPSAAVVERAKNLAKAEALFALDGGSQSLAEAMTASVMETGTFSVAGVSEAYDAVTEADVAAAFGDMKKAGPAVASVGDIASVPYHATIASCFS
uniref:Peptidase M16 N-terminal domain-containing protein n=1 Tax=Trieres chinensis TaxID=1514140 RepID=A0A7S1Z109_TRICV